MSIGVSGKDVKIVNKDVSQIGVRNSDNALIKEKLGWKPSLSLESGIRKTIVG